MSSQGFSLLELLIVLFISSIILSFAYPSYQNYILRTQRLEGQLALLDLANRMEQYYAKHHTYAQATIGNGTEHAVLDNAFTPHQYYALKITHASDLHFIVQAIPQGSQGQIDTLCQTLQVDDQGRQMTVAGPRGMPKGNWDECWR